MEPDRQLAEAIEGARAAHFDADGYACRYPAFAVSRERGATTMELGTATDDTAARGLYEALGFTNLEKPGDPGTSMLYYEREL